MPDTDQIATIKLLTRIEGDIKSICSTQERMEEEVRGVKEEMKKDYASLDRVKYVEVRVDKIESGIAKIVWAIVLTVLGAVLSLVFIN
jgi:hypothetical protein